MRKVYPLRTVLDLSFWGIILLLAFLISIFEVYLVKRYVFDKVQEQVRNDLRTARMVYGYQLEKIKAVFQFAGPESDFSSLKETTGLDYVYLVSRETALAHPSEIVRLAASRGKSQGGTRVMDKAEISQLGPSYEERAFIKVKPTPKARPSNKEYIQTAMVIEYAQPFLDAQGQVTQVLYAGKMINRNFKFIDDMVGAVFEKKFLKGKPMGTVTVFLDDVRIATNVVDQEGRCAVGTLLSATVYRRVVEQGQDWSARAFVVTDWYITAYEPIRDIHQKIIGALYVGLLERPFVDLERNIFLVLFGLIGGVGALAMAVAYRIAATLSGPVTKTTEAARLLAKGDLSHRIQARGGIEEFNGLMDSFDTMAQRLKDRAESLRNAKEQLETLNKGYLDLVGFVSHELKGILSSIVLNTYLLQNKMLGEINERQGKTLQSMSRNLDYLTTTVKNFLSLSRLEKGELHLTKNEFLLKEHVFSVALEAFQQQAIEKGIEIIDDMAEGLLVVGDLGLMQIVANNLLSNATKYGVNKGKLRLATRLVGDMVEVEIYNDGQPIASIDVDKLFKKFSRVVYTGMERVKGSGVGLFITREIIEKHGGKIWVEPRPNGNAFIFQIPAKRSLDKPAA